MNKRRLSIIIPVYNEQDNIKYAIQELEQVMEGLAICYEIIFVDDGSADESWNNILEWSEQKSFIKGIHFSRNFGKEAAIFAGLKKSEGDCCVVMDCDLQHPPRKIIEMYQLWLEGYEVIEGIKLDRGKEHYLYQFFSNLFYKLISKATKINMKDSSDFKLLDRKAVDALLELDERNAFFRALSFWIGFKKITVSYEVQERKNGNSKWTRHMLFQYALTNISSFSSAPMQFVTILGEIVLSFSIILSIITLWMKMTGNAVEGFTTVIIAVLFIGSIIMISMGIIGYYISKIYEEVKKRPKYIISCECGIDINTEENKKEDNKYEKI